MNEETIFADPKDFWYYTQNCLTCRDVEDTDEVNHRLVTFLTTVATHIKIHVNDDQDLYRCGLYLVDSPLYVENTVFCVAKELTLLLMDQLPQSVKLVLSYMLLLDCKRDSSTLQVIQDHRGFEVFYRSLHSLFETLAVMDGDSGDSGTVGTMKKTCTAQLDTLFQMCKFLSISAEELAIMDTFFVNYIFESLVVTDIEEDMLNASKFRFILAVNEQFMIACRDDPKLENRVFTTIQQHVSSRNFSECLLVFFNRVEDTCLQIMISKILYLILTTPDTMDLFYHNDLNVLVDVLLRELTNLSEEEENTRNTFLRVLHPLLKNEQFAQTPYKKDQLRNILRYFAGESENKFWNQTETTQRLAKRCLSVAWLQDKPATEEKQPDEVQPSPTDSSPTTPRLPYLELIHSNDSQTSLASISKKRPPPPLPRKAMRIIGGPSPQVTARTIR
ncbi:CYFA0S01e18690g1_1 [Cyberlindnera fabianii]|uniref:CYFA0S01e18690g1_1 n=1 Tax=Cyberlindnera fabianii TaxID=36022 RepID=A0A061AJY1_CYBFA|nr:Protein LDB17 [Cyberlindnera fabianii]CDR37882.1 CYFA0S01e18690g1_1 [Cyberlindnera fabianii]